MTNKMIFLNDQHEENFINFSSCNLELQKDDFKIYYCIFFSLPFIFSRFSKSNCEKILEIIFEKDPEKYDFEDNKFKVNFSFGEKELIRIGYLFYNKKIKENDLEELIKEKTLDNEYNLFLIKIKNSFF